MGVDKRQEFLIISGHRDEPQIKTVKGYPVLISGVTEYQFYLWFCKEERLWRVGEVTTARCVGWGGTKQGAIEMTEHNFKITSKSKVRKLIRKYAGLFKKTLKAV